MQENKVIDFALGRLSPEESLRMLDLIENDKELSSQLELANDIINVSAEHSAELFENDRDKRRRSYFPVVRFVTRQIPARLARRALETALVVLVALSLIAYLSRNPYASLATAERDIAIERVRGLDGQELTSAIVAFEDGRLAESISLFERFLRRHPGSPNAGAVKISIAIEYFNLSRNGLLFFPAYDTAYVGAGIDQLKSVIDSPGSDRLKEDAHWLLANAYLMCGQVDQAVPELDRVVGIRARHGGQAAILLEEIRKLDRQE
jgi:tetratricopeptide (TPR) repeat protein